MHNLSVILAHNSYLERGGEDVSFEEEKNLLSEKHDVRVYLRDNHEILSYSARETLGLAIRTVWARDSYAAIKNMFREGVPTICHFNNTFPLISPSAYDACYEAGVPVVQNLRNYRLICPNGYLFRDGAVCEECVGKHIPWPGVAHACYRDSIVQSAVVAAMLSYHNLKGTWAKKVDAYIALTEFSRLKFVQGGLPPERIFVKPNFAFDRGVATVKGTYALFIGRLIDGKGVLELLDAWRGCKQIPLKIVGDGPLAGKVRSIIEATNLKNVEVVGQVRSAQALLILKNARYLVYPSIWYENFPRVLLEAFSCGRPVAASNVGASAEIVRAGITGLLFNPGDRSDLAAKCQWLWEHPEDGARMGENARREYEKKYTPERNYEMLMAIYSKAMARESL